MKKLFCFLMALLSFIAVHGQNSAIMTFSCQTVNGEYVQPDSISIENLSKGWTETLIYPDTVYSLTVGVNVPVRGGEEGIQVIPNPFNGTATVNVNSFVTEFVRMQLTDISGKACAKYSGMLQAGGNLFTISAPSPNTYILSIQTSRGMNSVKMVNTGYGNAGKITPNGFYESSKTLKSKGTSYSPFDIGDTLRYHCYFNAFGHVRKSLDVIHYSGILWPTPDDTLHFTFVMEGIPCPAQPIVFDADSNSYNTVLIGNQCWMRENLKTTHYSNGTPIMYGSELSEDNALWYYPCGEVNDSTYGLLYNWKAVMAAGVQQPTWVCTPAQLCQAGIFRVTKNGRSFWNM